MQLPQFEDIISRLDKGQTWSFSGGVHPAGNKHLSNQTCTVHPSLPEQLIVPVRQHIGTDGQILVKEGEQVKKGQPLTQSSQAFSVPIHAPTSGTIKAIGDHVTAHPSGLSETCIQITPDGHDTWVSLTPTPHYLEIEKSELVSQICNAGVAGMGGAGFPSHIKASGSKSVEFLIINGIECEPYITADDRLMREQAASILEGVDILTHLLSPRAVVIAIEDNKPDAIAVMKQACESRTDIHLVTVPTKYPAGGEKQLIQILTGREVPRDGLPIDVGITMFNVGTCFAVADAILRGKPLIERIVTVTGSAVERPGNYWARIGTPVNHLLSVAGYLPKQQKQPEVIMGGPMMGFTLNDAAVPVVKTTNCLLIPAHNELTHGSDERACIRCSACADACPVHLLPQQLFWHSKAKEYDKAQEYNLFDCIECGACAYVCPSEIPLVHYYRKAKSDIRVERDERNKADKAKARFEARKARLEREKLEREAKHQKAKEARLAAVDNKTTSSSKDKVAAALARAKAKKAQQAGNSDATANETSSAPQDNKKAAVAAAVARAKAKKAAQQAAQQHTDTPPASNKSTDGQNVPPVSDSAEDAQAEKKQRVAAAVARAKAKKAAQQAAQQHTDTPPASNESTDGQNVPPVSDSAEDAQAAKKQRIAAAVAKAKAKKAAQEKNK
ncbi:electron transport complex subunit RsxC [Alteromonas sp. C1M14]|uniref:electron transport complex subunit RsxC n=1 Tax=Alteromonas sp. C1M14 TaxID=2841567 RepID=UPI001C092F5B|nr:electron transport complex subunit RsxC [Alteromonas sp. C1M14]